MNLRNLFGALTLALAAALGGYALYAWKQSRVIGQGYTDGSCNIGINIVETGPAPPHCKGYRNLGFGPVPLSFNSYGYRDKEYALLKKKGVFRIALLGASVHVGPGLPDSEIPTTMIEEELKKIGVDNVEVLNFSVEGYASFHHADYMPTYLTFKPNLVLFAMLDTHKPFRDLWMEEFVIRSGPGSVSRLNYPRVMGPDWLMLKSVMKFSPFLKAVIVHYEQAYAQYSQTRRLTGFPAGSAEQAKALLSSTIGLMNEMKSLSKKAGAEFLYIWTGESLGNEIALRIKDSPVLVNSYSSVIKEVKIDAPVALSVLQQSGHTALDISSDFPPLRRNEDYLGSTYYFSSVGMRRFAAALATSLKPVIQRARGKNLF